MSSTTIVQSTVRIDGTHAAAERVSELALSLSWLDAYRYRAPWMLTHQGELVPLHAVLEAVGIYAPLDRPARDVFVPPQVAFLCLNGSVIDVLGAISPYVTSTSEGNPAHVVTLTEGQSAPRGYIFENGDMHEIEVAMKISLGERIHPCCDRLHHKN